MTLTIQETGYIIREQEQELLPATPFATPSKKRIPRHIISRGYVLANPKNFSEFGTALVIIAGKASVYNNSPNFKT